MRRIRTIISSATFFGLALALPPPSFADSFGLSLDDFGDLVGCSGLCSAKAPGVSVQLQGVNSYSDQFSLSVPGGTSIFNGSISGGDILARLQTTISPGVSSSIGADFWWSDTLTALGPTGQTGIFLIHLFFGETATATVPNAAALQDVVYHSALIDRSTGPLLLAESVSLLNTGGTFRRSTSIVVSWAAGLTYQVTTSLQIRNLISAINGVSSEVVSYDESDFVGVTITSLTPGFAYSSASGITYSPPVPEPSALLLMSTGLAGLLVMRWRKPRSTSVR